MKEEFQVITEKKAETAILVGIITQDQDERKTNEYLDELEFLADTAGVRVMRRFTQKIPQALAATYVGKGKLEEMIRQKRSVFFLTSCLRKVTTEEKASRSR